MDMLARPNIASKETWVRQYDHEVIAQTVVKPFVGVERDGPGDAGLIAPIHGDSQGLVVSCGIARDIPISMQERWLQPQSMRPFETLYALASISTRWQVWIISAGQTQLNRRKPGWEVQLAQLVRANRELERVCRATAPLCFR